MIKVLGFCVCEIVIEIGYRNIIKIYFFLDKKNDNFIYCIYVFYLFRLYFDNLVMIMIMFI